MPGSNIPEAVKAEKVLLLPIFTNKSVTRLRGICRRQNKLEGVEWRVVTYWFVK